MLSILNLTLKSIYDHVFEINSSIYQTGLSFVLTDDKPVFIY